MDNSRYDREPNGLHNNNYKGPVGYYNLNKCGDIRIFFYGNTSTFKSQLLGYVHKLFPHIIFTFRMLSYSVGLTALVVVDLKTQDLVLEYITLVLGIRTYTALTSSVI